MIEKSFEGYRQVSWGGQEEPLNWMAVLGWESKICYEAEEILRVLTVQKNDQASSSPCRNLKAPQPIMAW
jgi:hypothetical protein